MLYRGISRDINPHSRTLTFTKKYSVMHTSMNAKSAPDMVCTCTIKSSWSYGVASPVDTAVLWLEPWDGSWGSLAFRAPCMVAEVRCGLRLRGELELCDDRDARDDRRDLLAILEIACPEVVELRFPHGFEQVLSLSRILRVDEMPCLTSLRFEHFLCAEDVVALVASPEFGRLRHLSFVVDRDLCDREEGQEDPRHCCRCCLDDKGVRVLAAAVRAGWCPVLVRLTLRNGYLSPEALGDLAEAVGSDGSSIRELDLCDNLIERRGAEALVAALRGNDTLEVLDLSRNLLWDREAAQVVGALRTCHGLRTLSLRGNHITDPGALAVALAIAGGRALAGTLAGGYPRLVALDLSDNFVGADGRTALEVAMPLGAKVLT